MRCPYCRLDNDRVIDSRASHEGFAIRRRRECLACKRRYTTYERLEETAMKVIKKDGGRVPFQREKIRRGLEKACWKRPISAPQIEDVVTAVETQIHSGYDSEVESREVGELVMQHLRKLDQVAYVRFASVYRRFEDVDAFMEMLHGLVHAEPAKPEPVEPEPVEGEPKPLEAVRETGGTGRRG
jgi:transcriptional repressor NrdR